jgi:hypothetical protein
MNVYKITKAHKVFLTNTIKEKWQPQFEILALISQALLKGLPIDIYLT